jgi:transposase InsO family protein
VLPKNPAHREEAPDAVQWLSDNGPQYTATATVLYAHDQHVFRDFGQARQAVQAWIRWYNDDRPHQALGYRSPRQFRASEAAAASRASVRR